MVLKERIYSVLVVSSQEKFDNSITALLPETNYSMVKIVKSVAAAKREFLERQYDFVLINAPLPDDFGTRFAIDLCCKSSIEVLLFVKTELYDEIYDKAVDFGVHVVSKPTTSQIVSNSLRMLSASRERLRRLEKKTISVEEKIEEIRLINRAKWILIDRLNMSEAQAHRYIEKQAMNKCTSKRDIAETIIKKHIP